MLLVVGIAKCLCRAYPLFIPNISVLFLNDTDELHEHMEEVDALLALEKELFVHF